MTDGDTNSYWKSNPYLTQAYTGESDALHPQWVFLDLANSLPVSAIRIAWAEPYAVNYEVQYWTGEDPIKKPTLGVWVTFPGGAVHEGRGGAVTLQLADQPIAAQWVRILMRQSSNTATRMDRLTSGTAWAMRFASCTWAGPRPTESFTT